MWISLTNLTTHSSNGPGTFLIGIANASLGATTNATVGQLTNILTTNVTYTVVTRLVLSNQLSTIWLNPNSESDPSATASDYVDPTNYANIAAYALRQSSPPGGTVYIDNLAVGTAFGDVAGPKRSPTISSIPNQSIPKGGNTGPLAFTVTDTETPATDLTVGATSYNTNLVPNNPANLTLGGSGAARTITVTPKSDQQGSATIYVTVGDGTNTSFTSIKLKVGEPVISAIPNQIAVTNTTVPAIPFTVVDPESDSLTFWKSSSNTNLLTTNNIALGGSGANRTVTLTPAPGVAGVTKVTIYVTDGFTTNSTSFMLTMRPLLGVLLSDNFSYTTWTFGIPRALYGADGSPWVHVSGSNYQLQVTADGMAELIYTNSEDLGAPLSGAPYPASNGVVFYSGFTVVFTTLPSQSGSYFAHFKDTAAGTSTFLDRVFAATTNAAPGCFRLGTANYSPNMSAQYPRDLCLNHTYVVVTRYNSGTGESWLWVNPASENSPNVAATDNPSTSPVGGYGLRQDSGIGILDMDNLVIGTSFSDVASAVSAITLNKQVSGTDLVLSWSNPLFTLQTAPAVTGPYTDVPCATSPYNNAITGSEQYFRLRY